MSGLHSDALDSREKFQAFLGSGADINSLDGLGVTPLISAIMKLAYRPEEPELVTLAIEAGVDPNAADKNGNGPLHCATLFQDSPAIVKALLEAGSDPNLKDATGKTVLQSAVSGGNLKFVELLIEAGAEIDAEDDNGATALTQAARRNRPEIVRALLDAGADLNGREYGMFSALYYATKSDSPEMVRLLLSRGANANETFPERGFASEVRHGVTVLMHAVEVASPNTVQTLIDGGGDPDARDSEGFTALTRAVISGDWSKNSDVLLNNGADPNARDRVGYTVLMLSVLIGNNREIIVPKLLASGADKSLKKIGKNAGLTAYDLLNWKLKFSALGKMLKP